MISLRESLPFILLMSFALAALLRKCWRWLTTIPGKEGTSEPCPNIQEDNGTQGIDDAPSVQSGWSSLEDSSTRRALEVIDEPRVMTGAKPRPTDSEVTPKDRQDPSLLEHTGQPRQTMLDALLIFSQELSKSRKEHVEVGLLQEKGESLDLAT